MTRSLKDLFVFCCLVVAGFLAAMLFATDFGRSSATALNWEGYDNRSYVLMADTFLKGRLANPTPDFWQSFETAHVLMTPTYASKYPPGYGLVLALGKLLGHYLVASWLSVGFFAGLLYLLLRFLLPSFWSAYAALCSIIVAIERWRWTGSYGWQGEFYAVAGALSLWGVFRYLKKADLCSCLVIGAGVGVIALIRPLEGLVFCVGLACVLLPRIFTLGPAPALRRLLVLSLLPLVAVAFTAVVNGAVTGKWYLFPHALYSRIYMPTYKHTIFDSDKALPDMRNKELAAAAGRLHKEEEIKCDWGHFIEEFIWKGSPLTGSWLGALMLLVLCRHLAANPFLRAAGILMFFLLVALALDVIHLARYFAMWYAPCIVLFVWAWLTLAYAGRFWILRVFPGRRWIVVVYRCIVALALMVPVCADLLSDCHFRMELSRVRQIYLSGLKSIPVQPGLYGPSQELERILSGQGERFLVFVYRDGGTDSFVWDGWLHNGPDLDAEKIIWARSINQEWDSKVACRYGRDRKIIYLSAYDKDMAVLVDQKAFYKRE